MKKTSASYLRELEKLHDKITSGDPSLSESIKVLKKVTLLRKKLDTGLFNKKSLIKIVKETGSGDFETYDFKEA